MRGGRAPGTVVALVVTGMVLVHGCQPSRPRVISGTAMGTRYHVKLADTGSPLDAIEHELEALLEAIEEDASQWRKASWISRFNAGDSLEPVSVRGHVWEMLLVAEEVHGASGGLLDVTIAPLVELWGFGHQPDPPAGVPPTDEELARTLARCGSDKLVLDHRAQTVRRTVPGLRIDLSALAKGYAVDRIDALLQGYGLKNYLIELGGELFARGTRPGAAEPSEGWRVRLPCHHGKARTIIAIDTAYATSGGIEQNRVIGGAIVTHLVDPRTGRPTPDATAAVTVTADRCILADAWATALSVATRAEARQLAQKAGIDLMDWRD